MVISSIWKNFPRICQSCSGKSYRNIITRYLQTCLFRFFTLHDINCKKLKLSLYPYKSNPRDFVRYSILCALKATYVHSRHIITISMIIITTTTIITIKNLDRQLDFDHPFFFLFFSLHHFCARIWHVYSRRAFQIWATMMNVTYSSREKFGTY